MIILVRVVSNIFKWSWSILNFTRVFIINIIIFIIIILSINRYLQMQYFKPIFTKGALILNLTGTLVDKPVTYYNINNIIRELIGLSSKQENSLFEIVSILRQAKNDNNITGLVLDLKYFFGADQVALQYIGKALREFSNSGKPIYAIGDNYNQAQYFIASYADIIYLNKYGSVNLHGFSTNKLYFKTLLDNLKIKSHVFRVGKYKSAVEPFLRDSMSDDAKNDDFRWLNQFWQQYLSIVANNRHIDKQTLFPGAKKILEELRAVNGDTAQYALNNKLVDQIASRAVIEEKMIKYFGWNQQTKSFNGISIYDYPLKNLTSFNKNNHAKIAVIFASGAIIDGLEKSGLAGGETIFKQIRDARLNPEIKAIILRVNSPGGSVSASELIHAELVTTRFTSGKPIVVSMGGIAASGGYWISVAANSIVASPNTLTGSIGIFGIVNNIENTLDSIGIHTDGVSTSPLAENYITKTLPLEINDTIQINIDHGYNKFINVVSKYRKKTKKEINTIAQGHVWSGKDALTHGLIDHLGDFDDAINIAVKLAKIKDYELVWYTNNFNFINHLWYSNILNFFLRKNHIYHYIDSYILNFNKLYHSNFEFNDPKHSYAFCLSCNIQI